LFFLAATLAFLEDISLALFLQVGLYSCGVLLTRGALGVKNVPQDFPVFLFFHRLPFFNTFLEFSSSPFPKPTLSFGY